MILIVVLLGIIPEITLPQRHDPAELVWPPLALILRIDYYSGRKADRVKVSVALSNSFFFLGSRWAER